MAFVILGAMLAGILMVFFSALSIPDGNVIGAIFVTTIAIIVDFLISVFVAILMGDDDIAGPAAIGTFTVIMLIMGVWMIVNV